MVTGAENFNVAVVFFPCILVHVSDFKAAFFLFVEASVTSVHISLKKQKFYYY